VLQNVAVVEILARIAFKAHTFKAPGVDAPNVVPNE
jgi:hypothetical protein